MSWGIIAGTIVTAAGGSATTAAVVGAGVSAAAGIYTANKGKSKNPQIPDLKNASFQATPEALGDPVFVDIFGTAERTSDFNTKTGIPRARKAAQEINEEQLAFFESAMGQLFGGVDKFRKQQALVNEATEAQLRGELSPGTKQQLGRAALSSNITELGPAAVGTAYTGFLGLTAEQQTQQGQNAFQGLYSLYASQVPRTSAADLLGFTGLSTGQAIQGELQNAQQANQFALTEFNALQELDRLAYQQNVAQQGVGSNQAIASARNPNAALYGAIGGAISTYGGQAARNTFGTKAPVYDTTTGKRIQNYDPQTGKALSGIGAS